MLLRFFFFGIHFRACWGTELYVALPVNKYVFPRPSFLLFSFSPLPSITSLLSDASSFASRQSSDIINGHYVLWNFWDNNQSELCTVITNYLIVS